MFAVVRFLARMRLRLAVIHGVRNFAAVRILPRNGEFVIKRIGRIAVFRHFRPEGVFVEEAVEHAEIFVEVRNFLPERSLFRLRRKGNAAHRARTAGKQPRRGDRPQRIGALRALLRLRSRAAAESAVKPCKPAFRPAVASRKRKERRPRQYRRRNCK